MGQKEAPFYFAVHFALFYLAVWYILAVPMLVSTRSTLIITTRTPMNMMADILVWKCTAIFGWG